MRKILLATLMMFALMTKMAFAQTETDGDKTVRTVYMDPEDVAELPAPGPGETVRVVINVPEEAPPTSAPAPITNITNVTSVTSGGNRLSLRGGPSFGLSLVSEGDPSYTGGVVGEIGRSKSPWRVQGSFRVGSCADEHLALEGGFAVTRAIVRHFRMGAGADLLYCADTDSHPIEQATERIVSASFKSAYEFGPFVLEGSIGVGKKTEPTPGSRKTDNVVIGGLSFTYLFGK